MSCPHSRPATGDASSVTFQMRQALGGPLLAAFVLFAPGVPALAATLFPAALEFSRPLTPPPNPQGEIGSFVLDASLYEDLDDRLGNLRLFDSRNRETPFLIRRKAPDQTREELVPFPSPLSIESLQEQDGNRLELTVSRDPGQPRPAALEFGSGIRNFEKLVTVSGSRDGATWTELARNEPIYDYSRYAAVRRDRVRLEPGDYTRYRIDISNINEQKDSPLVEIIRQTRGGRESNEVEATSFRREPFHIDRLTFYERRQVLTSGIGETELVAIKGVTCVQDTKRQTTVIEFTSRREPLSALTLVTEDANFSREVTVEGRTDGAPAVWRGIAQARVDRIRVGKVNQEHLVVEFPAETRYGAYRMTVHNQDNPPLNVTGMLARRNLYEALFLPRPGQTYRVGWGGEAAPPHYDLGAVLSAVPAGAAEVWQLGPEERVKPAEGASRLWQGFGRKAMVGALVAMVAILGVLIARLARKIEPQ